MSALESCRRFREPRAVPLGHTTELERGFLSGLKHQASVGVTLILPVRASHLCLREQILLKHISTLTGRGLRESSGRRCPPGSRGHGAPPRPSVRGGGAHAGLLSSPLFLSTGCRGADTVLGGTRNPPALSLSLCLERSGELLGCPPAEAKSPGPRVARPAVGPLQRREFVFTVFYRPQGKQAP